MAAVILNSTCVQQFWNPSTFAALNTTDFDLVSACGLPDRDTDDFGWGSLYIYLSVLMNLFFMILAVIHVDKYRSTIKRFYTLPTYQLHKEIENLYLEKLKGWELDFYRENWKGRYLDVS